MPDTRIDIPGVGPVDFPDSMNDAQINAAATRLYQNARVAAGATSQDQKASAPLAASIAPASNVGLAAAIPAAAPTAARALASGAMELATNPNVPRMAATAGRVAGAVAPVAKFGLPGALGSAKGAWLGGKAGWYTGKLAQQVAAPIASALEQAAPYAQTLSTLGNAQGALELAQMAEPERRDIGVLGVGASVQSGAIPTAPELVAMPTEAAVKTLTDAGWPESRAKSYVTQMRKLLAR